MIQAKNSAISTQNRAIFAVHLKEWGSRKIVVSAMTQGMLMVQADMDANASKDVLLPPWADFHAS